MNTKRLELYDLVSIKVRASVYAQEGHAGYGPLPFTFEGAIGRIVHGKTMSGLALIPSWVIQIVGPPTSRHLGERLDLDMIIFTILHPLEVLALDFEPVQHHPGAVKFSPHNSTPKGKRPP